MILAMNLSFVMEAGAGQVAADGLTSEILEDEKLSTAHGQQFSVCCSLRSLRRRNYSQNAAEDCGLSLYMFIMRIAGPGMAVAKSLDKSATCRPEQSEGSLQRLRDSHRTGARRKCRSRRTRFLRATKLDLGKTTE